MKMAIAVENLKHPKNRSHYRIWYLESDHLGNVLSIGALSKEDLIADLFKSYKKNGKSNWRAFLKSKEESIEIELFDFMAQGMFENTHFGNLPTLCEFQETLDLLQINLDVTPIAC
ncbi:MAG: hypothetical protein H6622_17805 [Halobacteriovoraceae bacterium]|nr:hypothetical protein [Halobacteriovoraceae bacterium]